MKRIISFILTLAMALSMAACGGSGGGNVAGNDDTQATPQPTPTPKVLSDTLAISQYDEENITNDYTGLEFTLTGGWSMIDRETMCTVYMPGVTAQQLEEMNADQLNGLIEVFDYVTIDTHGHIIMVAIANYAAANLSAEEYLNTFKKNNFPVEANLTDEKTVTLSGVEYKNFTAYYDNLVNDVCYLDRGDGHLVMVISRLKGNVSPYYAHAFFNGGPLTDTDIDNVPGLFEYDAEKVRIINTDAAIEIDIPDGWAAANRQHIAKEYYNTDENTLNSMTASDLARLSEINDIVLTKDDGSIAVIVSYINRKADYAYGMSALEMAQHMYYQCNVNEMFAAVTEEISFSGQNYAAADMYSFDSDSTLVYFFRELNEDYMVNVTLYAKGDQFVHDLREIFDKDNDTDMLIKRSQLIESKYQYHNPYTDIRFNFLKDWVNIDEKMINWLYGGKLTEADIDGWTDAQYMQAQAIADFGVASPDGQQYMYVYYLNLNELYDDHKADMWEYYEEEIKSLDDIGFIATERDIVYVLKDMNTLVYEGTSADGKRAVQFAVAEISDDYVMVTLANRPADESLPNIFGMLVH